MSTETKAEKFTRLAPARMESVLDKIRILGHLSASAYETDTNMAEEFFTALGDATDELRSGFGLPSANTAPEHAEIAHETSQDHSGQPTPPSPAQPSAAPTYGGPEWALVSGALASIINGDNELAREQLHRALAT